MIFRSSTSNITLLSLKLRDDDFTLMDLGSFAEINCPSTKDTPTEPITSRLPETPSLSSVTPPGTSRTANTTHVTASATTDTHATTMTSVTTQPAQSKKQLADFISALNGTVNRTVATNIVNNLSGTIGSQSSSNPNDNNKLIQAVEKLLQIIEMENETLTIQTPSLTVGLKKVNGTNFQKTSFTMTDSGLQVDGGSTNGSTPQGSIVLPASLLNNLSPKEKNQTSRIQFCFYQQTSLFQYGVLNTTKLISGVLASSVAALNISGLRENVMITLRNTESVSSDKNVLCTFWKSDLNNGSGGWSSDGCTVLSSTANETVCSCNHLTSFALLLDFSNQSITSYQQVIILNNITYIGCGISSIFLMVTLVMYLRSEKLRKVVPNKILIQLCFALLLLNLVFFLDSFLAKQLDSVGLCIPTVFFLSYFLLVSFTWVALESVHIYLTIVKVFNNYVAHFMVKVTLVGWGIPLIVVIIPVAINKSVYGITSTMLDNGSMEYLQVVFDYSFIY
ncbi:hypothetical protein MHYP_G00194900 [Metynnis hypsauchen]